MLATAPTIAPPFFLPTHLGPDFDLTAPPPSPRPMHPLLITFFRGHWCPYCRRYLAKLRDHFPRLSPLTSHILAISPDPVETSRNLAAELQLPFLLLSDLTGEAITAFRVRNHFTSSRANIPHPAVFILSPAREILFQSIDRNYKKRTTLRTLTNELLTHQPQA